MNTTLADILKSRKVTDSEGESRPLHSGVRKETGLFLQKVIRENDYRSVLEVGFAHGISALYIGEELKGRDGARHLIIDPAQSKGWKNTGVENLKRAGFSFELVEKGSEIALPALLETGERFDLGFIDGWHTFDHALLDFFYLSRLVRVGGMIVLDDADFPSVSKVAAYVSQYPCFELVLPELGAVARVRNRAKGWLRRPFTRDEKIFPRVVGFRKIAEDERGWDWYRGF